MATTGQLIRAPRRTRTEKTKVPALGAAPQKRGVCTRVYTTTPKKPKVAASIVAKVHRDRLMDEMDEVYPGYGFRQHKGYGTAEHIRALREKGPCPEHRRSFIGRILGGAL